MITLVMPYYLNAGMLAFHYAEWVTWPEKLKSKLKVIIVDDGSPQPAVDVPRPDGLPMIEIYRVHEDRPWHQHGARNLGAHVVDDDWMVMTDMDHVLDQANFSNLLKKLPYLHKHAAYMLDRVEGDTGSPTLHPESKRHKPHPNSFVFTRKTYWRIGGYDEDFCGIYGTDAMFRQRIQSKSLLLHLHGVALTRYWRDLIPDSSTTTLARKEGRDADAKQKALKKKIEAGRRDTILTLDFTWERVL